MSVAVVHPSDKGKPMSKFAAMALAVEKPQRMTIINPATGQPVRDQSGAEAYIDLHSGDSETARKFDRAATDRRLNVRGRTKVRAAELEAEIPARLAALTAGWHLVGFDDGAVMEVTCNLQNAAELYADPGLAWLRDDALRFVDDRANFSKASSGS